MGNLLLFPQAEPQPADLIVTAHTSLLLPLRPGDVITYAPAPMYPPGTLVVAAEPLRLTRYRQQLNWKHVLGKVTTIQLSD